MLLCNNKTEYNIVIIIIVSLVCIKLRKINHVLVGWTIFQFLVATCTGTLTTLFNINEMWQIDTLHSTICNLNFKLGCMFLSFFLFLIFILQRTRNHIKKDCCIAACNSLNKSLAFTTPSMHQK